MMRSRDVNGSNLDPFHASHRNGVNEAGSAFGLVVVAGIIGLSVFDPSLLTHFWVWFLLQSLACLAGYFARKLVLAANSPHPTMSPQSLRALREEDRRKQLEKAKKSGAFDRFEK